ncbi:hypothetical protein ACFPTY_05830 [Halomonas beimenensis]|uniref:Uncharacterized protein n=1 Tax=Halomonas beimenensis TaxID=475662 RepID=A0A291P6J6_9GAMM|nr:hypothetical protein [Halomonas beimenensis]ATJ82495.1 hypothetical protein BEI_1508 [Halomonas beimenensis]
MNDFTEERVSSLCLRMSYLPGIIENRNLDDEIYMLILEYFKEELERVIQEARTSNVVAFPQRRRRSLGLQDQGR